MKLWAAREKYGIAPRPIIRAGQKDSYWFTPTEEVATRTLHSGIAKYLPGERSVLHRHNHEQLFYIISGRGYAVIDGKRYELEAGDVLFIDANVAHCTGSDAAAPDGMRWFYVCGPWQTPYRDEWLEIVPEN